MRRSKPKFTQHQIETTVQVLVQSNLVRNWALGEMRAYGIPESSPAGIKFLHDKSREIALKIIG